jgi:hypothetical protein
MNKLEEFKFEASLPDKRNGAMLELLNNIFRNRVSLAPLRIALIVAIGLFFCGWGTVNAAQDSLPNDFLYPVKIAKEKLHLSITSGTEAKASILTTNIGNRIDEASTLYSLGTPIPEEIPDLVDQHSDELFALIAGMEEETLLEALKGVQIHDRDQIQNMTNAMKGIPEGKDSQLIRLLAMLKERRQLVQMGLGEPNYFQQKFRHQLGKPTLSVTETLTSTISTTLTTTPEITVTMTITNGNYGPGPCENPGDCLQPGPFGTPTPGEQNGFGPGSDQGVGPYQPTVTPNNPNNPGNGKKNGK